jgi:hypothetical protein
MSFSVCATEASRSPVDPAATPISRRSPAWYSQRSVGVAFQVY